MTTYDSVEGLRAALDGSVLRLTLDREQARNAISDTMLYALIDHLVAAASDEAVRVIAVTSSGPHFCSGADLVARNASSESRPRVGSIQRRLPSMANRLIPLLTSTQTPIVVAARGWVSGLGFHLALGADFCVVADDAKLWEPFMRRGFTPDSGAAWLLPRVVGMVRARQLLLLGRELTGTEAAEWGLVHQAVPDAELEGTAEALVQQLAEAPTVALGLTKWLLHSGVGIDLERALQNEALALELSSRSEDFREGLAAFKEKRDPRFQGR